MIRLVTFLGLGAKEPPYYTPCRYRLGSVVTSETPNHDAAALLASGGPCSVVVLGTKEVRDRWFLEGRSYEQTLFEALDHATRPRVGFRELPRGETDAERWAIFDVVASSLSHSRLELSHPSGEQWVEDESPSQIILDVTHGFRSQPFLAAAAVAFVRSQREREQLPTPPPLQILYAAYEARGRDGGTAPVWDLTQLIDVLSWDAAIDGLMRHGRADRLKELVQLEQQRANQRTRQEGASGYPPRLKRFGEAAARFADGLATARVPELMTMLAGDLDRAIEQSQRDLVPLVPPLGPQLKLLGEWAKEIVSPRAIGPSGVSAGLALCKRYLKLERFSEVAIALRETLVTAHGLSTRPESALLSPGRGEADGPAEGPNAFRRQREEYETDLGRRANRGEPGLPELYRKLADLRNDIEHGGFRPQPREGSKLRSELERLLEEAGQVLAPSRLVLVPRLEGEPSAKPFLNLSNHPVSSWSKAQLDAARALSLGEPTDFEGGLPLVDPESDEESVERLARQLADRAEKLGARGAHVAGEHSLTYALVRALAARNIPSFVATTERQVTETQGEGGVTVKQSAFSFVRWRSYPGTTA